MPSSSRILCIKLYTTKVWTLAVTLAVLRSQPELFARHSTCKWRCVPWEILSGKSSMVRKHLKIGSILTTKQGPRLHISGRAPARVRKHSPGTKKTKARTEAVPRRAARLDLRRHRNTSRVVEMLNGQPSSSNSTYDSAPDHAVQNFEEKITKATTNKTAKLNSWVEASTSVQSQTRTLSVLTTVFLSKRTQAVYFPITVKGSNGRPQKSQTSLVAFITNHGADEVLPLKPTPPFPPTIPSRHL